MLGNNPGAMFMAVTKLSCEIVESGWGKDRALVDTFIMGLAACLRERNDYEEQVCLHLLHLMKGFLLHNMCDVERNFV